MSWVLKPLLGRVFGSYTVIAEFAGDNRTMCMCRCACGVERAVTRSNLTRTRTAEGPVSCRRCANIRINKEHGRPKRPKRVEPKMLWTGRVFARWTVLSEPNESRVLCRCSCGVEKNVLRGRLTNGRSRGCMSCATKDLRKEGPPVFVHKNAHPNLIDRTGQRFGMLTVLRREGKTSTGAAWLCRCDCGVEKTIGSQSLRIGVQSCGCLNGRPNQSYSGRVDRRWPDKECAARSRVFKTYQAGAKRRALEWNISKEFFLAVTQQACHYCGVPPSRKHETARGGVYVYNGVDRPDNAIGYVESNVVACCSQCNLAKGAMTQDEFLAWADRLAAHRALTRSPA